jgi:hypothetical protein
MHLLELALPPSLQAWLWLPALQPALLLLLLCPLAS